MERESLTAEAIVKIAEAKAKTDSIKAIRRQINKLFREQNKSTADKAIQKAHRWERKAGVGMDDSLEYALFLEMTTSLIANKNY